MATFRLDRSTDASGTSERIMDDHGVIALVKARGKAVNAGRMLAAAPELLDVAKCLRQHLALFCGPDDQIAAEIFRISDAAIAKAEGRP